MTLRTTRCRPRHSPASSRPANCRWPWPHSSLRAPEIGRPGQGQEPAAEHDPGRCDQVGLDQDGRILPRHHLRQTGLAANLAHLRRNLWGGAGRSGQRVIPACIRRTLGRRHPVIIGRPELPHWRKGPQQPEIRQQPRADVLYTYISDTRVRTAWPWSCVS